MLKTLGIRLEGPGLGLNVGCEGWGLGLCRWLHHWKMQKTASDIYRIPKKRVGRGASYFCTGSYL